MEIASLLVAIVGLVGLVGAILYLARH